MESLRDRAVIVGIGQTDFSKNSGRSELALAAECVKAAIQDAGLSPRDIDGMTTFTLDSTDEIEVARSLGIGDLTFNQQYVVGQNDIRGYTQGEYRGNYLVAAQGEYRFNRWGRWGLVGFFGLATVFDGINEGDNGKILPGIGTGIRFTAFPENHMNVGMDIAVGDGDWGLYFRVSEAF